MEILSRSERKEPRWPGFLHSRLSNSFLAANHRDRIMYHEKNLMFWKALRRAKRIRSPIVGWTLIFLGVVTGLMVVYSCTFIHDPTKLSATNKFNYYKIVGVIGILAGFPFYLIGRRFVQQKAEDALRDGRGEIRPFILYLRSFQTDAGWHGWFTEPRLSQVLKQIGVPVCVGRPGERLPQYGFHRIYFADEDWQASVLEMASRAKCIVVFMGETGGFEWEMRQLIANRWLSKTVLLVPTRDHERHRATLREQHRMDIPPLQSHYHAPYSPRPFDLCPIGFEGIAPVGSMVVPTLLFIDPQALPLDLVFRRAMRMIITIIPFLKRYDWLIDRNRSPLHTNFGLTLEPILRRIDSTFTYKKRFMGKYR
jgi:hypothetical protein